MSNPAKHGGSAGLKVKREHDDYAPSPTNAGLYATLPAVQAVLPAGNGVLQPIPSYLYPHLPKNDDDEHIARFSEIYKAVADNEENDDLDDTGEGDGNGDGDDGAQAGAPSSSSTANSAVSSSNSSSSSSSSSAAAAAASTSSSPSEPKLPRELRMLLYGSGDGSGARSNKCRKKSPAAAERHLFTKSYDPTGAKYAAYADALLVSDGLPTDPRALSSKFQQAQLWEAEHKRRMAEVDVRIEAARVRKQELQEQLLGGNSGAIDALRQREAALQAARAKAAALQAQAESAAAAGDRAWMVGRRVDRAIDAKTQERAELQRQVEEKQRLVNELEAKGALRPDLIACVIDPKRHTHLDAKPEALVAHYRSKHRPISVRLDVGVEFPRPFTSAVRCPFNGLHWIPFMKASDSGNESDPGYHRLLIESPDWPTGVPASWLFSMSQLSAIALYRTKALREHLLKHCPEFDEELKDAAGSSDAKTRAEAVRKRVDDLFSPETSDWASKPEHKPLLNKLQQAARGLGPTAPKGVAF